MARKTAATKTPAPKAAAAAPVAAPSKKPASTATPVRNTAIPKVIAKAAAAASPAPRQITHDMIAARAYEIACSGDCGSDFDNWVRAERELRGA